MSLEVNAQAVIDNLLEQNKRLVLEIAVLQAQLSQQEQQDSSQDSE